MDWKLELVAVPVSDVDRAIHFYAEQVGFHLDHDHPRERRDALRAVAPLRARRARSPSAPDSWTRRRVRCRAPDRGGRRRGGPGPSGRGGVEVSEVQTFAWGRSCSSPTPTATAGPCSRSAHPLDFKHGREPHHPRTGADEFCRSTAVSPPDTPDPKRIPDMSSPLAIEPRPGEELRRHPRRRRSGPRRPRGRGLRPARSERRRQDHHHPDARHAAAARRGTARGARPRRRARGRRGARRVSLTGQFASVDEDLTGLENLVLIARLLGLLARTAARRPTSCSTPSVSPKQPTGR